MARKLKKSVYDSMPYLKESEEKEKRKLKQSVYEDMPYLKENRGDDNIAPVAESKGGNKDSWFKGGAFSDGYQFGDATKAGLGTAGDIVLGAYKGAGRMVEGLLDLGTYGVAGVADLFGADEFAEKAKKEARRSRIDEFTSGATDFVDKYSVLGNKGDMISEGLGQVASLIVTGGLAGAAGLGGAGVTAVTTGATGLSSMGTNMGEAYDSGASDNEAFWYGLGTGAIEAGTELLFGGLGKSVKALGISRGIGGLDDIFAKKLSRQIAGSITNEAVQKALGNTVEYAVKASGEGFEEVLSGLGSAVMKKLTYEDDETLWKLIEDEKLLEQYIVGTVTSSIVQGGDFVKANKGGTDFVTGQTTADEKVINKLVEDEVAKRKEKGETVSARDKNKIYDSVVEQMEKGQLDINTIESVLGGDKYTAYKDHVDNTTKLKTELNELRNMKASEMTDIQTSRMNELKEMNLDDTTKRSELRNALDDTLAPMLKNSKLTESYREAARRRETFAADLSKYKGKQREAVERAIKSGVLNNTYRSHELVELLSKIEAEKGIVFDYVNNDKLKETGFALEGKTVNGFANKSKGTVTLNVQSAKAWQSVVGHEVTHILEGTDAYDSLRTALYEYATSKGELESRRASLTKLYNGMDADIETELTADLVGDYLFTDKAFINKLTGNRNLFEKIYDEIKYLWNAATGKEKTEIEKVKAEFDKAWKELAVQGTNEDVSEADDSGEADVDYSISVTDKATLDSLNEQVARGEYDAETNPDGGYYVTYKSMSFWGYDEDGNAILRSPMAEYVDGELSNAYLIPKDKSKLNWYQATETIDEGTGLPSGLLVKTKQESKKSFSYLPASENQHLINEDWSNLYFNLRKKVQKNGKWVNSDVPARYNPYEHSSNSMLNDQFSAAYLRDNLVTVKMYVPISEDNGAYRAKWSKDPTGWSDWKTGTVAGKIGKQKDLQRRVYLSRYAAPVEIVPDSEVAQAYKGYLEGTDVAIPDNVVSPNLLSELKKAGVPIEESGKVQYSVSADSDADYMSAVERGDTETAQRMVDEVAKAAGYDIKAYHGTGYDFTVFDKSKQGDNYQNWGRLGKGFYFAPTSREAETWAELSRGGKNKVMSVYLRSENMLDSFEALPDNLKDAIPAEWEGLTRRLAEKYAYNFIEYMQEFGYNVQEILTAKGYDGINGHTEFVVFDPEQVKSADTVTYDDKGGVIPLSERFDTANEDIRFSLSEPVEQTKNLVALHNLTADKLLKSLELGGLPMPSLAITKSDIPHSNFGDITLVFGKETIDPKKNKKNKVYSADAWTPIFPRVEYEADSNVVSRVNQKLSELEGRIDEYFERDLSRIGDSIEDYLNNQGGEEGLIQYVMDNYGLKAAYLEDTGNHIERVTRQEEVPRKFNPASADKYQQVMDILGITTAEEAMQYNLKEARDNHGAELEEVFPGITQSGIRMGKVLGMVSSYLQGKDAAPEYRTVTDSDATRQAVDNALDAEGYEAWVRDLFSGVAKDSGIYNNADIFTPSGRRRTFKQTHYPVTLENIVKAMASQNDGNAKNVSGFNGVKTLRAATAETFKSIDEMHQREGRLQHLTEEQANEIVDTLNSRLSSVIEAIDAENSQKGDRNPYIRYDQIGEAITEIGEGGKYNVADIQRIFSEYGRTVSDDIALDVKQLLFDVAQMPVNIFEAKPQRVVSFDEAKVFVIPNNVDAKLKQELLNRGYSIAEYDPNVEGDRQRVVNQFEEYKFSLSNAGEDYAPIGDYSTPFRELALDAPVATDTNVGDTTTDAPMLENIPVLPDEELETGTIAAIRPKPTEQPRLKKVDNTASKARVAQVLVEEPKTEKNKQNIFSKAAANFIDKGAAAENLSLKTKNRALQDTYKAIGRAETKAQYFMEHGKGDVKSLDDIRAEVEKTGKVQDFYNYIYHKHNIDRMSLESKERPNLERLTAEMNSLKLLNLHENQLRAIASEKITEDTSPKRANLIKTVKEYLASKDVKNKPVFDYSVTAEMSREAVKEYEAKNPDFKKYAQDVYDNMNHLRKMMVYEGIISPETAELWAEMYPHYVPIRRVGHKGEAINVPLDTNKTGINAPIKSATGGNSDILPLFETMAQRTMQTFKAISKNRFGIELKDTLGGVTESTKTSLDETIDSIDSHEDLLQEGKNGANPTFTVFEGGERVTFDITEELYDAMKPTSKGLSYTNKVLNTASDLHRGLLTEYNIPFMLTNAIKDTQDVLINSQHPAKTYANFPAAIKELTTKGKWYTEYMENGGGDITYFDKQTNTFTKEKSTLRKVVGFPFDKVSDANNFIEKVPRLAEYIASRKAGASVDAAMLDASRVTTDFSSGGDVTKFLNRNGATFLNASVQGFAQQVRNVREAKMNGLKGWLGLAAKYAIAGLPAMLLNHLLWDDDEEYEELSDYVKENYYVVAKYGDGKFVRIPKGRTLAVIQNGFEQIGNVLTGDDEADFGRFFELCISNLAPNNPLDNNIIAPIKQVAENKTWYGEDLVPTRLQDLPAAEQYDESTDAISKWLGEKTNTSPYKINYLLNQYSGGIGDMLLPMLTPEAERGDDSFAGNMIAPLKDKFTTDSVMNNQNVSDFYDTVDALAKNANSSYATDEDILKSKYMNSVNSELGALYKEKREIQNSDLSDKAKYERVREIQKQINALAKESLATYESVKVDNGYATAGDRHYKVNKDGEWEKITDKQLEKQNKVTRGLGISASEYWSNKDEYDYAYDSPEKYALAKSVGGYSAYKAYSSELYDIEADKDASGKSINGSRKEKVIDYINNLDADYYTKIILYKSEYTSDDTYNSEIVDYIVNRADLTYEDRVAILTQLGFRVTADGQIYAD